MAVVVIAVIAVLNKRLDFLGFLGRALGFAVLFFRLFSLAGVFMPIFGKEFPHSGQKDTPLSRRAFRFGAASRQRKGCEIFILVSWGRFTPSLAEFRKAKRMTHGET
ncbi:hypothetical protein [Acutalibacter sp. 1XD8-33]|uniref:hypothetical protein n=1 Tax=Acutalibacter sp. 1XD8-33 TaxID=2320081 RepID=UPI0011C48EFA|nr:hypothetical protein [Acutalibacter sp. 1XD8-33]